MKALPILGLLAVLWLPCAHAWVPEETDVWADGDIPISFDFGNAPGTLDWSAAARDAVAQWNGLLQRVQLKVVPLSTPAWYDNGHNEFFFDSQLYGQPFPSGVLAVTTITTDRGTRVETDVIFNRQQSWDIYHGKLTSRSDFRRVAAHELGHVLGLDHPDEAGQTVSALMNSTESDVESPTADDIAGIHGLYDVGSTARPVILGSPNSNTGTVVEGNWVKFKISAGGRGPLTYQWMRDGAAVAGATAASLQLAAAKLSDAGNYTVNVANAAGPSLSTAIALAVTPATPPTLAPENLNSAVTVTCGNDYTLTAHDVNVGSSPTQWQWKHNGVPIGTSSAAAFTLSDLQFSDSGAYDVTVSNVGGSVNGMTWHLTVVPAEPPQFLDDTGDFAFIAGTSSSLTANATGTGTLQYQWYKNGAAIPSGTNRTLSLATVSAADAATYTVTATNAFGTVSSAAQVVSVVTSTVVAPPSIVQQPGPVTEFAGAPAGFAVTTEGDNLAYQWYKDGQPYRTATGALWTQAVLSFAAVKESDSGNYSVTVSNSAGSATSRAALLTVLPPRAPVIMSQPSGYTGAPGQSVQLGVGMQQLAAVGSNIGNDQYYRFEWFKDGVSLGAGAGSTLSLSGTESDSGKYFVRVTSVAGATTDSDAAAVTIKAGVTPLIKQLPGSFLLDSSNAESLRLTGVAWEVYIRRLASSGVTASYVQQTVSGPTISGISPGTYVISASDGTKTETTPPFTVGFLPAIVPVLGRQPAGRNADIGDNFTLDMYADAYAPMTYQWSKDGTDLPGATNYQLWFPNFTSDQAGTYRVAVTSSAGTTLSEPAVVARRVDGPPLIRGQPGSFVTGIDRLVTFQVDAAGGGLSYQWYKDGQAVAGQTASQFYVFVGGTDVAGNYAVKVSNSAGTVTSRTATLRVVLPQRPPDITLQPKATVAAVNGDAVFSACASGGPLPDHYQWRKDGVDILGANDVELRLHTVQASDAGSYSVVISNANGSVTTMAAPLTVDTSGRLINLSTRSQVGTGGDILIAGFVVTGDKPRTLLIRGVGDQLSAYGVHGVLRDPFLQLFDAKSNVISSSDDWASGDDYDAARLARIAQLRAAEQEVGAFALREDTRDAAVVATVAPGLYSAQVSGLHNTTGVGLVEIYEMGTPSRNRLTNLSCRSRVGTGENALFVGFGIKGTTKRRMLIRAVGPSLGAFHIDGTIADPLLTLYRGDTPIVTNDNWGDGGALPAIRDAENKVGAFPLATASADAAMLVDLDPGLYSCKVTGANDSTGIALVEVYEVTN